MGFKTDHIVKLLQLNGIGRRTALKIFDLAKDEVINDDSDLNEFLLKCSTNKDLRRFHGIARSDIVDAINRSEEILENSAKENITILSISDADFPGPLKLIEDRPILLNFKGNFKELNSRFGVALVGMRDPSE